MFKSKRVFDLIISVLLFFIVVLTYRFLLQSFFQQDEWYSLGQALSGGIFAGLHNVPIPFFLAGYIRFPGTLLNNLIHILFPLNSLPFAILSILLHSINSICLYFLVMLLTKRRINASISALFFAVSTVHQQAITWFAAVTTALPSLTFSLLSITVCLLGIQKKRRAFIFISQLLMIISFLFKESSIVLFLLLPLLQISGIKFSRKHIFYLVRLYFPSILYVLFVLSVRAFILTSPLGRVGIFITTEKNSSNLLLIHLITYPFIGISQTFIPFQLFSSFLNIFIKEYQLLIHYMDIISIFLSLGLIALIIFLSNKYKNQRFSLVISIFIMFASFLPLAVLKRDNTSYFESRYYYLSSVGASIILGVVISLFSNKKLIQLLICMFFFGYMYKNISLTRSTLLQANIESSERKYILNQIKSFFPLPNKNPIFLIDGDSLGYYGIPNQRLPFQQGIGFTLMVLYYSNGIIPNQFLDQALYWDVHQQGYTYIDDSGFGYYSSFSSLKKDWDQFKFKDTDSIYAVYWHSGDKKLENITNQTRNKISQ